jgi:hypothetical protein
MRISDILFALLGAWLFALLFKGKDVIALAKNDTQRTPDEKKKVKSGLFRSLLIEFSILVPASTALILLILPFASRLLAQSGPLERLLAESFEIRGSFYVIVGVFSYNFPFAAVRQVATRIALNTIKDFYEQRRDHESQETYLGKSTRT